MKILSLISLFAAVAFLSCDEQSNVTPNGYEIIRHNQSNGDKPAVGDYAFVHIYAFVDGVLETSTRQQDRLMPILVYSDEELVKMEESGKPNPVYDAVSVMSVGDSITVNMPITEEMKKQPRFANSKEMHYDIVMVESKTSEGYKAEQEEAKRAQQEQAKANKARESEIAAKVTEIAAQYTSGQLDGEITTTDSGLKYMVLKEGDGPATKPGNSVKVNYYGALTNGKTFDNSFKRGQPFQFPLGAGRVIKGWDEGVALLKSGDQAVLFIPSELGYGKAGSGPNIPGDSELIFYIEVL